MDQANPIEQVRGFLAHAARESFPFLQFETERSLALFYVLKEVGFPVRRVQRYIHMDARATGGPTRSSQCCGFVLDDANEQDNFAGLMGEPTHEVAQAQFVSRQVGSSALVKADKDWIVVPDLPVSAYRGNSVGEIPKTELEHMVREGKALFDQWQIREATPTTPSVRISPRL